MTEKLTDALYEETLARIADGHIDLGGTIGLRRWCDGSGPCAVETEPHGHWRGGVSVSTREVILRLLKERDEARAEVADLLAGADAAQFMLTQAYRERDEARAALANAKEQSPYIWCEKHEWEDVQPCVFCSREAATLIYRHDDNCASHAGHACTCTYAPPIPSLGVKP